MMPSMAFQKPIRRATAEVEASFNQSMTNASNSAVKPELGSAHGTVDVTRRARAFHPRHIGLQDRLVLHVPGGASDDGAIVTWRRCTGNMAVTRFPFHVDDDLWGISTSTSADSPRCLNTQYPGV